MGPEIRKPNHMKSGQMATILSKTLWNPDKNFQNLQVYLILQIMVQIELLSSELEDQQASPPT